MRRYWVLSALLAVFLLTVAPFNSSCGAAHFGYRALREGVEGEDVWNLQSALGKMGHFDCSPTGRFGCQTAAAVRRFQVSRGIKPTGDVSGETLSALITLVAMLEWNEFGYEVKEGDTLQSIASAYDIPADVIASLNGLPADVRLVAGDRIHIPVPAFTMHLVEKGETLSGIAVQYGVSWKALAGWNSIRPPYTIYVGQTLVIPLES